ncbi:hypothetical protein EJB05_49252, partial [Eragrostis curvula]
MCTIVAIRAPKVKHTSLISMYATKPLSLFKSHPEAASCLSPEGQNSCYLVVKSADEDGEDGETCCWGTCGGTPVRDLPFPQNRVLTVRYTEKHGETNTTYADADAVVFVPVPDQPLSSNRYYAVIASGKHKGLVRTCSSEEDMVPCCFCRCIKDAKPRPFDPADVYQQMEIVQKRPGKFTAKAVAPDGFPHFLYRKKHWRVFASMPKNFDLGEAPGTDSALRSRHLAEVSLVEAFSAPMNFAVGKWYCPFYLIQEDGMAPSEQMDRSAFYEVTLEQLWEAVDARGGSKTTSKKELIAGNVEAEEEAAGSSRHGDAYVWFRAAAAGQKIGVATSVLERMLWEQYKGGWVGNEENDGHVAAGVLVLVERFVVKRMDGTVAVAFDFAHLNKVRAKQG